MRLAFGAAGAVLLVAEQDRSGLELRQIPIFRDARVLNVKILRARIGRSGQRNEDADQRDRG